MARSDGGYVVGKGYIAATIADCCDIGQISVPSGSISNQLALYNDITNYNCTLKSSADRHIPDYTYQNNEALLYYDLTKRGGHHPDPIDPTITRQLRIIVPYYNNFLYRNESYGSIEPPKTIPSEAFVEHTFYKNEITFSWLNKPSNLIQQEIGSLTYSIQGGSITENDGGPGNKSSIALFTLTIPSLSINNSGDVVFTSNSSVLSTSSPTVDNSWWWYTYDRVVYPAFKPTDVTDKLYTGTATITPGETTKITPQKIEITLTDSSNNAYTVEVYLALNHQNPTQVGNNAYTYRI